MLCAESLSVSRGAKTVLSDISLELRPGEVFGVLGANGAGKSTLLAALCGELAASAGRVSLHGKPLGDWADCKRAQQLAVLPQSSNLNFAFRVEEVVTMGRLPHASGKQHDDEIVQAALAQVDAGHLLGRSYLELSGGERQRVHLARVLAQLWPGENGSVLLLDEPTSMLDPLHQQQTLQAVRELAKCGAAILVILHDLNLAARYCDRLLLLKDGRSERQGSIREVLQVAPLKAVFGLDLLILAHPEQDCPLIVPR